jgi:hypothetical protein
MSCSGSKCTSSGLGRSDVALKTRSCSTTVTIERNIFALFDRQSYPEASSLAETERTHKALLDTTLRTPAELDEKALVQGNFSILAKEASVSGH